jgi:hypothetical protein
MVTDCGAPSLIKSDNAPEFKGKHWVTYLWKHQIPSAFTEGHHLNKDYCEHCGGVLKAAVVHTLSVTAAELVSWCYCLEYITLLQSVLAHQSLGWRTSQELHFGEMPDISMFRFVFWCPVWYYAPQCSFPKSKMRPGCFLGLIKNTGDAFCYLILTESETANGQVCQVITRSVVQQQYPQESRPVVEQYSTTLHFYKSDGCTPLEDPSPQDALPLLDLVAEELRESASFTNEDLSHDDDAADLLQDAINEVYGPPCKHPCVDDHTAATDTAAQPQVATPPGSPVEASLSEVQSPPSVPDPKSTPHNTFRSLQSV